MSSNQSCNVCVLRVGAIGDVIHTLPLINILAQKIPNSKITYLMAPELVDLLQFAKGIDQIFPLKLKVNPLKIIDQAKQVKNFLSNADILL
ncbi:MAG TPA: hypothetical protein V6C96_04710, partial [Vampirovibrionales bacterium]